MFISSMEWLKKEEDILYNSQFFLDDTGVLLGTYRKVHLFDSEKNYFTPGDQFKVFDTKIGRIGLFICYDAFFPETARSLDPLGRILASINDEKDGIVTSCSRSGGSHGWQLYSISRWTAADGRKLKKHLEMEFENKKNTQIYWDDVAMFCYPDEYQLGIYEMQKGDIIEIDNLQELAEIDSSYKKYMED